MAYAQERGILSWMLFLLRSWSRECLSAVPVVSREIWSAKVLRQFCVCCTSLERWAEYVDCHGVPTVSVTIVPDKNLYVASVEDEAQSVSWKLSPLFTELQTSHSQQLKF